MFNNLFAYFGPVWSAVALLALVSLLFVVAAAETVRLLMAGERPRARLLALRLTRAQRRLVAGWSGPAQAAVRWSRTHARRPGRRE